MDWKTYLAIYVLVIIVFLILNYMFWKTIGKDYEWNDCKDQESTNGTKRISQEQPPQVQSVQELFLLQQKNNRK